MKTINTTANEQFQKLLEQSKYNATPELPKNLPRLDIPMEKPSEKTLAINQSIKDSIATAMGPGLSEATLKGLTQVANEMNKESIKPEELKEEEEDDSFWYDERGNKIRNLHNNRKRRKAIEARCLEMDIMELITNGVVEQTVPIAPPKFVVTFKSLSGKENLLIQSIIAKETSNTDKISKWYITHKIGMLQLATSIVRINNKAYPTIKGVDGKPSEELLLKKFELISELPIDIIMDLDVNYIWFTERVKSLSVVDNIINF